MPLGPMSAEQLFESYLAGTADPCSHVCAIVRQLGAALNALRSALFMLRWLTCLAGVCLLA